MSLVAVVIPVTLLLVLCGVCAFFWAVRTGQFEELDAPGWEVLMDEQGDLVPREETPGETP